MIVGTFNIRGLGSRVKKRKVRELISSEKLDFLALQETKLVGVSDSLCVRLWGSADCAWAALPAVGNSGGVLSLWRKSLGTTVFSFTGEGFVGVCLDLVDKQIRCCVINVYSKCNLRDKRRLWQEVLMTRRGFGEIVWCIVGDFNSITNSIERRGSSGGNGVGREMEEFGDFLRQLELVDMSLLGRQFTWFHPNGNVMSRLDRVLLSAEWLNLWGVPNVWVAARDVSDHCPLIIKYSNEDWGPKPFRFNNFWLRHKDFKEVVSNAWNSQEVSGWMGFILKERLKFLKGVIKLWSKEVYGKPEEKKKRLVEEIKALDLKSEMVGLSVEEVGLRKQLFEELWVVLKSIDASIFQRSRSKWLKEGDSNTKYFHMCVNSKRRANTISALKTPLGWVEGPASIREATVTYFNNHFSNDEWIRPNLDGVTFP
jgi:exonuclease III